MKRAAALLLLAGCYLPREKVSVHVNVPLELTADSARVSVLPRIAEGRRTARRGALTLELKRDAGKVRLELPGACPLLIDTRILAPGAELRLLPLFDFGPSERVVGLGKRFELRAVPRCPEADAARVTFEVAGGAPLDDVQQSNRRFAATTGVDVPTTGAVIVPVSARVAQTLRTALRFRIELPSGERVEQQLGVSAAARSSGLPDVGLHHPVLLSGDDWVLRERPHDSGAALRHAGRLLELVPDRTGRYRLENGAGKTLALHSGRYDETPLDCGRSGCHAEIARSAESSPMTQALASDLGGCHTLSAPECAIACHATGEPGVTDGGFSHVMAELGLGTLPAEYDDLPRALRRVGGVGCLACHGPTRIPQPTARAAILKNDVCAVCHDAPPRYGHLQALASCRMGRADAAPATRSEPCARCHTTWGALGRPAPALEAPAEGLACVTCHDVHPHPPSSAPSHAGLLRRLPLPSSAASLPSSLLGVSRVCVSCHAPEAGPEPPQASAVAILAGQGGLEPKTGAPLELPPPHAASPRGCLACHDSGPSGLVMGQSHGFRATDAACQRCHEAPPRRDPTLATRARALLERLAPELAHAEPGAPWHARSAPLPKNAARARALRDVLLVLEDPAADVHHPRYAEALLDAAATELPP